MVRKIQGGDGPKSVGETGASGSVKGVDQAKAAEVSQVSGTKAQSGLQSVRGGGYAISAETREQIFQLIHEEADRMFGPDGLPVKKRKTVEGAVKMAVDASIVEEEKSKSRPGGPTKK